MIEALIANGSSAVNGRTTGANDVENAHKSANAVWALHTKIYNFLQNTHTCNANKHPKGSAPATAALAHKQTNFDNMMKKNRHRSGDCYLRYVSHRVRVHKIVTHNHLAKTQVDCKKEVDIMSATRKNMINHVSATHPWKTEKKGKLTDATFETAAEGVKGAIATVKQWADVDVALYDETMRATLRHEKMDEAWKAANKAYVWFYQSGSQMMLQHRTEGGWNNQNAAYRFGWRVQNNRSARFQRRCVRRIREYEMKLTMRY